MALRHRYRVRATGRPVLSGAIAAAYIFANLVHAARIFDLFWADASRVAYAIELLVPLGYMGLAVLRGRFGVALAAALTLAFLVGEHLLFAYNSGIPTNFNTLLMYIPLLGFVVFTEINLRIATIARICLVISALYAFFYVAGGYYIVSTFARDDRALLMDHTGAGVRVFFVGAYAMFVAFVALRDRGMPVWLRASLTGIAIAAVFLADSRTYLAMAALVYGLAVLTPMPRPLRFGILAAIYTGVGAMLLGVFVSEWSPFVFSNDSSAITRHHEYFIAVRTVRDHWLLGVGIPPDGMALQSYLRTPRYEPVFGSDLGGLGPWFDFGLLGLAAFLVAIYVAVMTPRLSSEPVMQGLQLVCLLNAFDAIISPMLVFEPTVIFLMLMIAYMIRRVRLQRLNGEEPGFRDLPYNFRGA